MSESKENIFLVGEDLKKDHYAKVVDGELVEVSLERVLEKPRNFDEWIEQVKQIFCYKGYWVLGMQCSNYSYLSIYKGRYKRGKSPIKAVKMTLAKL